MKILHIVGGSFRGGAYQGANILHQALLESKIDSKILNDTYLNRTIINSNYSNKDVFYVNKNFYNNVKIKLSVLLEKVLKTIFLKKPRSAFTIGLFGLDITKIKEYKTADIVHIHWLNQGFINIKSLSKIDKPIVWTIRDMWPFTGGAHYTIDFEKYEKSFLSRFMKNYKKKNYLKNVKFVAISDWLKNCAKNSYVLKNYEIEKIYNNINLENFKLIEKKIARSTLKISTEKKIISYGANNPQNVRKGWDIFLQTLRKLDKSKYYLLIFGNFWSSKTLDEIGIEYKSVGYVDDKKILNAVYSSSDIFVFPSIQEAFGKTWAEAIACNIPVVCFDNTSASEIIEHKKDGYLVEKIDPDELKKGIDWVSEKIDKNNFNKKINDKLNIFDSKKIVKKYIKIYKNLLVNKSNDE